MNPRMWFSFLLNSNFWINVGIKKGQLINGLLFYLREDFNCAPFVDVEHNFNNVTQVSLVMRGTNISELF